MEMHLLQAVQAVMSNQVKIGGNIKVVMRNLGPITRFFDGVGRHYQEAQTT